MKKIIILCICAFVGIFDFAFADSTLNAENIIFNAAKSGLAESLKDPDSAKFKELYIGKKRTFPADNEANESTDVLYVYGLINSKNSYGGYSGYNMFYIGILYLSDVKKAISIPSDSFIYSGQEDDSVAAEQLFRERCSK
ncbi:hypothetical protein [Acetobacter orientalis]|uniref:hypothetical protein n=1 Tax=Acetobacter orientalis TaxID=146474 RepID=UPI0039E84EFF